ncbi:pyrroline-5-carboxylate reductase [Halanaerobium hydrogeniformans]|uniref:Pyrroline-5-carboxylate reductase n=1 Tax=Halanaerobium hydrogeniformans TaxID=656519 RepID=E4RJ56_HALHG|nr:pyrroline-5-carboxylate reductase [Halanaerobium hydrogeniformans]ADQ15276.1 pyrroline-5-carboxylate reductase [Halanaerobium hydrogeniformans]
MKLAIIGLGNMGQTILDGILKNNILVAEEIAAADKKFAADDFSLKNKYPGLYFTAENKEAVLKADYVILAVKPQIFSKVLSEIKTICDDKTIISIAAGIKRAFIEEQVPNNTGVVRVMPNTPALVGEGMSALSFSKKLAEKEKTFVKSIFKSFGKIIEIEEEQMDAVTALSGSGPAFVYLFIEALSDAGVLNGLDREKALKLAAQTVKGGAEMILQSKKHPAELKDMVTSPGGTTIAGLASLEESAFRSAVIKAVSAAAKRSEELGK